MRRDPERAKASPGRRAELPLAAPRSDVRVPCRRVERLLTPAQHVSCPYCFGAPCDVRSSDHAAFCGYDPARDPRVFGFPAEFGRHLE